MYCWSFSSGSTFGSLNWGGFSVLRGAGEVDGDGTHSDGLSSNCLGVSCFGDCSGVFANKSTIIFERFSLTCALSVRSAMGFSISTFSLLLGGGGSGVLDFLCSSLSIFLFFSGCCCIAADFSSVCDFDFTLSSSSWITSTIAP